MTDETRAADVPLPREHEAREAFDDVLADSNDIDAAWMAAIRELRRVPLLHDGAAGGPGSVFRALAAERMREIAAHQEKYVEAWIAETGLSPSESELVEDRTHPLQTVYRVQRRAPSPQPQIFDQVAALSRSAAPPEVSAGALEAAKDEAWLGGGEQVWEQVEAMFGVKSQDELFALAQRIKAAVPAGAPAVPPTHEEM